MNFVKPLDLSKPLAFADLPAAYSVKGAVCTHGVKTFGLDTDKIKYSIGISVDQNIETTLNNISAQLAAYLIDYKITPVFKPKTNDAYKPTLFFNLKTYDDNYTFECNKSFDEFNTQVVNGTELTVYFTIGVYVNNTNKVAGLYYKISKIVVA